MNSNSIARHLAIISLTLLSFTAASNEKIGQQPIYIQVLASVGPLHQLSGAMVTLTDSSGSVVGRGKTNVRGAVMFSVTPTKAKKLPLTARTNGGYIVDSEIQEIRGPRFNGHLAGRITAISEQGHTIGYVDLLSTIAMRLSPGARNYLQALAKTRIAFGIGKTAPSSIIRYNNNHVGWLPLADAIGQKGGYDAYVKRSAKLIAAGGSINDLAPPRNTPKSGYTKPNVIKAKLASTSPYPQCDVPLGDGSNGLSSNESIAEFGVIGITQLLKYAGFPEIAEPFKEVGMLLVGGLTKSPEEKAIEQVDTQLQCISSQLNYLTEQIGYLQFTTDVNTASTCSNSITTQYYIYQSLVEQAAPQSNGQPSTFPLDGSNPSFVSDVNGWGPNNGTASLTNCGQQINASLFGNGGGQGSSWQQLNRNYQQIYKWYTTYEVQQLQQFMSWWSTIVYDAFVLTNEYYNFYQQFQNAQIAAGNYNSSPTICNANSKNQTPTYCVWQSNLKNAYPGNLYSDEIGIYTSGISVNPYPAGLAINSLGQATQAANSLGQTGLTTKWIFDTFGSQSFGVPTNYPASTAYSASVGAFNAIPLNHEGLPSAVETFANPQAYRNLNVVGSDLSILSSPGPEGISAGQFLLNAINQDASSQWVGLSPSSQPEPGQTNQGITFYAYDSQTEMFVSFGFNALYTVSSSNNPVNPVSSKGTCGGYLPCTAPFPNSVFGVLMGRNWWPGAGQATNYVPPDPPTP